MSQRLSMLGKKMGTTGLLLIFETLKMTQLKRIVMPDQLWSGLITTALSIKDRRNGMEKNIVKNSTIMTFKQSQHNINTTKSHQSQDEDSSITDIKE